jgi:hypothetical protein
VKASAITRQTPVHAAAGQADALDEMVDGIRD